MGHSYWEFALVFLLFTFVLAPVRVSLFVFVLPHSPAPSTFLPPQYEAIPESLKNMLLVMSTQGVFDNYTLQSDSRDILHSKTSSLSPRTLWMDTWERIDKFLPHFFALLFPNETQPYSLDDDTPSSVVGAGDGSDGGLNSDSQCNDNDGCGVAKDSLTPPTEDVDSSSSPLPIPSSSSSPSSLVLSGASCGSSPLHNSNSVARTSSSPSECRFVAY